MSDNLTAVLIVAMCVMGPIWLTMRYRMKARTGAGLNAADSARLEQALAMAQKMEQRVVTLERILDAEAPSWRANPEAGGLYERRAG